MPPHPTPSKIAHDISGAELEWLPCDQHAPQSAEYTSGLRTTSCALLKVNFFQNLTYHAKWTTSVEWNDTQASPRRFSDRRLSTEYCSWQGLSAMLVSPGKGSCRYHRLARLLARCHCKQWIPGRLIGPGVRSFRLEILQQKPIFIMNCEK